MPTAPPVLRPDTARSKLLLAGYALHAGGAETFTAEQLVIAAWGADHQCFGLVGYSDLHPDSNKTLSNLMGQNGLVARGLFDLRGPKLYALTMQGRIIARRMAADADPLAPKTRRAVTATHKQEQWLRRVFCTRAWELASEGRTLEISLTDAMRFWALVGETFGEAIRKALADFRLEIGQLERTADGAPLLLSDGREVEPEEIAKLAVLDRFIAEKFSVHLCVLSARKVHP